MVINHIFKEVPIGLCHFDLELRYTYINDWLAQLNGISPENHIGCTIREVLPDVAKHVEQLFQQVIDSGEPHLNGEVTAETPAQPGILRTFRHSYIPVKSENGSVTGLSCVVEEITDLRKAQNDLIQAKEKADESNRAKSRFLSTVSHELRTPMNAILGFAQILGINSSEPLSENQKSYIDHILKSGNHMMELIDDVLELNKIEEGKLSIHFDQIAVDKIIDDSVQLIRVLAQEKGVEILNKIASDDPPMLWTDGTRLTQVLLNLLSNAVKYNRHGGTVTISFEEISERMLRINVADTGIGIPEDKQQYLFEPFERLGRESGEIEGTGMGLAVTQRLIKLLNGNVGYQSNENKGSTFWIDVPINCERNTSAMSGSPS